MTNNLWIATHFARWGLSIYLVWVLVLPETGFWTALTLTLLFAGVEVKYLDPRHWTKN
jgi:hypothetical protein